MKAVITGVAGYVPDYILTNKELETIVDTTDEWIRSRTGIEERRILKIPGEGTSYLAAQAVNRLLKKTNTDPTEIELVICATTTPDMQFPATANVVCDKVGATNAFGYDINAACSGFLFALSTASKFIETGTYKKIIVIGADKMSSIINYADRTTCVIFGDGAGAVLLEAGEQYGIQDSLLKSDGSGRHFLHQKAGGSVKPASHETVDAGEHFVYQEGATVFKKAVRSLTSVCDQILKNNNLSISDVDWLVPHQANKRIIDSMVRATGIDPEKVMINIQRFGNTTNATIPLCLADWENKLKAGEKLILAAFGGGFTWGSIYLEWAYSKS